MVKIGGNVTKKVEIMKIALLQICSALDPAENIKKIKKMMKEAVDQGAQAIFLPEVFYSISNGLKPTPYLVEPGNEHYQQIASLSKEFGVYLLGGSAATLIEGKVMNRAYNFSPTGRELGFYDKINLFACDLSDDPSKKIIDEAMIYHSGTQKKVIEIGEYQLGLSICFDLRFPELYRSYSSDGANILSAASAFTVPTGKAHWHTLVRSRAIENQCYVIACGQWGEHTERLTSYGHSLVVDPWGEVLVDAREGEKVVYAQLDKELITRLRKRLKVIKKPCYI